jgi:glycosyltransferase involved in cell wall biosynthesis
MSAIAFVVNGTHDSAMGQRAQAFAARLAPEFAITLHYREGGRASAFWHHLAGLYGARPRAIYVFDLAFPGVMAAMAYRRATGCPVVIETGDAMAELLWSTGRVGRVGRLLLYRYEQLALRTANGVVIRGTYHKQHLEAHGIRVTAVIQDGVDVQHFRPLDVPDLRQELRLDIGIVVGVLGSLHWSPRLCWTTGMELVEALAALPSERILGLVVGTGSGLPFLRKAAERLKVLDRIRFVEGWKRHDELPRYINCMDICLSTQTNDLVGWVRTTGKLPLFLACGRFILATRVGEAARVLPEEMLLEYREGFDPTYPKRLASRIERLVQEPDLLHLGKQSRVVAEAEFDYGVLVPGVATVLRSVMGDTALQR